MFCQFMLSSCSADIEDKRGQTAAHVASVWGYRTLADYVEGFQPGPRGEFAISCCTQYSQYRSCIDSTATII